MGHPVYQGKRLVQDSNHWPMGDQTLSKGPIKELDIVTMSLISASYFESCQKQNCPESCGETEHSHLNNKIDQPPISSPAIILIFQFLKHFLGHAVQSRKTVVHLKVVKSSSCLKCGKTFQLNSLFYSLAKSWCLKQAFHCKNNYLKQSGWKYFLDSGSNKM